MVGYQVGDNVKITDGALESFLGTVEEIDLDRSKVRVVVSMFGRETPVELELDQVEPVKPDPCTLRGRRGPWRTDGGREPGTASCPCPTTFFIWRCSFVAQKVTGYVKLQIPAGKATPAPPVGPALGQHGVNIAAFTKEFNERTKNDVGLIIPVVITVYADRSFTFITKTPPAAVLIKKACNIESGSGVPNKTKVATISKEDVRKIAETKMPDLNAASIEAAMSMIAGTARSMGVVVGE